MDEKELRDKNKKSFWEGRAVMASVVAVTVFLCLLTTVELVAIKMEWNVPVISMLIGGSDNYFFSEYRKAEEKLEASTENVPYEEDTSQQQLTETLQGNTEVAVENENIENEITEATETVEMTEQPETDKEGTETNDTEQEEEFPYLLKINRQQNVVTAYTKDENGEYTVPVRAILCSTGLYNATPKGTFHLSSKYIWRQLHGGVYGQYASRITGGVLFHSVPYASKNKSSLYWEKYNKLGQQASMGCVRLTVEDAKWIYENCPSGTTVEVYDSEDPGPLGKPETLKLDKDNANRGWDPTDPDEKNPWHAWSKDE